jgi:transposase
MKAMAKHRTHSAEFKRQSPRTSLQARPLHGLAKRHDLSRNLIRIWVAKYEAGAFDDEARAADLLQEYEARIAALERMGAELPHRGIVVNSKKIRRLMARARLTAQVPQAVRGHDRQ